MLPEHITRELRYLEIYTARKMRNLRAGTYTAARVARASTSTSIARIGPATMCDGSIGT